MNISNYYHIKFGQPRGKKRIVSLDTEWAKNWRAVEKFVPFCMTIHSIYYDDEIINTEVLEIENLFMESELYFREENETTQSYVERIDNLLSKYLSDNTIFIGHQFSSDLHTLLQCSKKELKTVSYLIGKLRNRKKEQTNGFSVADTRYDLPSRIIGEERLRSVSLRLNIFAIQTELDEMSLTKMYNLYTKDNDILKKEKLQIMNWRHAFQTTLVWFVGGIYPQKRLFNKIFKKNFLLTNHIIYEMGKKYFSYLESKEFKDTLQYDNILKYVKKYYPQNIFLK